MKFSIHKSRRVTQFISLLVLHSSLLIGWQAKYICFPVLTCHSCPLYLFACPIGVLVHFSGYHVFPFIVIGTILLAGALLGRIFCGWICPFGYVQDLLHKIPSRKFRMPEWTGYIKYGVLVLMVFLLPFLLGELTFFSFCRICPVATLEVTTPALISSGQGLFNTANLVRYGVLGVVIVFVIMSSRSFCKVLCPIGALLAPLNYISLWVIKVPLYKCVGCKRCDEVCITDVKPSERISQGVPANRALDCVDCHACTAVLCPATNKKGPPVIPEQVSSTMQEKSS